MANGHQKAQENLSSFLTWSASLSDSDFTQMIFRGKLNRGELATGIGCGKSALTQNPELRKQIMLLENKLRERGVLPPLSAELKINVDTHQEYDHTKNRRLIETRRTSTLEQENIELKAKVTELEIKLKRYGELSETLADMGFMPR